MGSSPTLGAINGKTHTIVDYITSHSPIMPITKSAKKALRNSQNKTAINAYFKTGMKNAIKAAAKAVKAGATEAKELVVAAQKRIDKAAKKNVISKNSASRKVGALMSSVTKAVK
ncbi:MAG: 30S ribosomal protein S20 [Candidatus Absconditabacterales bacterium]